MEGPITGIVTMEPEQRRILDREEGERERERSVTYLHVIGRESDSITRSNRRSFLPLKCARRQRLLFRSHLFSTSSICHASSRSLNIHTS